MLMKWLYLQKKLQLKWLQCILLLCVQLPVLAQDSTASLTGTVLNEKGEAVAGVTVLAATTSGSERLTTLTSDQGIFAFQRLKVGSTYSFTASSIGYETAVVNTFTIKPGNNSLLVK